MRGLLLSMLSLGITLWPRNSGGGGATNSTEVQQFFDRLISLPSTTQQTNYANLIDGLVTAGVFSKLDFLYVYAAADEAAAFTDLVSGTYLGGRQDSTGNSTFTANSGFDGGAAGRQITSGFNPSTASSPKFTRNDGMVGVWSGTTTQINAHLVNLSTGGAVQSFEVEIYPKWSDNKSYLYSRWNVNGTEAGPTNGGDSSGLFIAQRTGANAAALYRNDVLLGSSASASSAVQSKLFNVTPFHLARAFFAGQSLSVAELTAVYSLLSAYITAVVGSTP